MYFKTKTDVAQNLIDNFSSNYDLSIARILIEKKYRGTGLISEKRKLCMQNLTKKRKQPTVVIL